MTLFDQAQFINNWNKIAKQCGSLFGKLPFLNEKGICGGFSFILAEYIRDNNEENFYKIINIIYSQTESLIVLIQKLNRSDEEELLLNEILDFIYRICILANLQRVDSYGHEVELSWNQLSPNHKRINNNPELANDTPCGIITNFIKLNNLINSLLENESYEIAIYNTNTTDAHSVLIYKKNNQFHIFNSNQGKNTYNTAEDATKGITLASNQLLTKGTNKYTLFDSLWDKSDIFKIFALALFPLTFFWILHDYCIDPLSEDKLKEKPLSKSLWLSWEKIRSKPKMDSTSIILQRGIPLPLTHASLTQAQPAVVTCEISSGRVTQEGITKLPSGSMSKWPFNTVGGTPSTEPRANALYYP